MDENKNTSAPEQVPAETKNCKLTGDSRTFLIAFLTAVIVVIAYHLVMETIKFFNQNSDICPVQMQQSSGDHFRGEHHGRRFHDGDRPMKKRKFRHFKDCVYYCESECEQKPMKGCKCVERIKKFRERRMQMQNPSAAKTAEKTAAKPAEKPAAGK
jgi:hypothetical protein